jgi:hypothetical protein
LPLADLIPAAFRRSGTVNAQFWEKKTRAPGGAAALGMSVSLPERTGYVPGIPQGGINEYTSAVGASSGTDRRSMLQEMFEAYLACPWSWTCVNVIARTITAGGLVTDWDADTGEGDQEEPEKPPEVIALERFYGFCNPVQDIRQLLRNVVADLEVFGDALLEVVWNGPTPVALYNLDTPTTSPNADEHGQITKYVQVTDFGQRAEFEPREVIHISLDSARPGVFGVSPTQAMLQPITSWLFAAATGKEMLRKGLPPTVHADLAAGTPDTEVTRWCNQAASQNLGSRNIGTPWVTRGGGKLAELQSGKLSDVLAAKSACRDEIVAGYGVPPAEAMIIESGNLGGGTGDSQHRALDLMTMIPTPSGWTTMGDLRVGDEVLDEAGKPCNVTGTYEVPDAESWRLEFSDGTHIDCCADHLWVTWTEEDRKAHGRCLYTDSNSVPENWPQWRSRRGRGPQVRKTSEVLETLERRNGAFRGNHSIPMTAPLELPDAGLPVDPYALGAWLGDGTACNSSITVATGEEQITDEIRAAGYVITERASQRMPGSGSFNVGGLMTTLRKMDVLGNKHVPAQYLRASKAQRLALLQGLMDTDGGFHSAGQQVVFRNTSERLADAVVELARSLGQKPVKTKGRSPLVGVKGQECADGRIDYGPSYTVTFCPTIQVFRLARKAALWNTDTGAGARLFHRFITGATQIANRPMRCITVDSPNSMYLAGEGMIPTHNTFLINTCDPIGNIVLEKLNFHIAVQGFGVKGWHSKFREVDYRDSVVVEQIRDMRVRNGSWSRNRYAADIGEPTVDGGDEPVLVERQSIIKWADIGRYSDAQIAALEATAVPGAAPPPIQESLATRRARLKDALAAYRAGGQIAEAQAAVTPDGSPEIAQAVYAQLARDFPPASIAWVKDAGIEWEGPTRVPADQIDLADKDQWAASKDGRVAAFVRKIGAKHAKGKQLKPAVYVRVSGSSKDIVVDGHHRTLAYLETGQAPYAYVGRVPELTTAITDLHDRQYPDHQIGTEGTGATA